MITNSLNTNFNSNTFQFSRKSNAIKAVALATVLPFTAIPANSSPVSNNINVSFSKETTNDVQSQLCNILHILNANSIYKKNELALENQYQTKSGDLTSVDLLSNSSSIIPLNVSLTLNGKCSSEKDLSFDVIDYDNKNKQIEDFVHIKKTDDGIKILLKENENENEIVSITKSEDEINFSFTKYGKNAIKNLINSKTEETKKRDILIKLTDMLFGSDLKLKSLGNDKYKMTTSFLGISIPMKANLIYNKDQKTLTAKSSSLSFVAKLLGDSEGSVIKDNKVVLPYISGTFVE